MFKFFKAFGYALNGVIIFFRHEQNGRIQLAVAVLVIALSVWLGLSSIEWIFILSCIAAVFSLEMINSAIEKLCNLVHPQIHPAVKTIKDISAGAVLMMAVFSLITGVIIYLPKLTALYKLNQH